LLEVLRLDGNALTGKIPAEIGFQNTTYGFSSLDVLRLDGNALTGSIPTEIGFLNSTLEVLRLDGNNLTGPIPTEFGLLSELRELRLEGNRLTGTIPTQIALLEHLEILTVDAALEGSIPSHVKTLEPCILCEGGTIDSMDTVSSFVFENDDQHTVDGVSCATLSDPHALLSFDACEALREHCVTCGEPHDDAPSAAGSRSRELDEGWGAG